MLAENIQTGAEQEQQKGREEGLEEGERLRAEKTARNLISLNALTDEQIAQATGLIKSKDKGKRQQDVVVC
ncbi:hypothetical protein [Halorhodospira halochloris]|uniref:hypothetical protein n=1 Tax=Halorhodospira halochloris TaxID=1052 RepID=UPI001EE7EA23|nr:hypothetical protein [Halorhodospira halochloris]MCG5548796.1 hypothetical protein [Halorhodospira halochloris]